MDTGGSVRTVHGALSAVPSCHGRSIEADIGYMLLMKAFRRVGKGLLTFEVSTGPGRSCVHLHYKGTEEVASRDMMN